MDTATERGDLTATLLLDASVIDDPYAFYRRLVAEAPVWCVPDTGIVIVSSFAAVSEVVSRVDDRFPRSRWERMPLQTDNCSSLESPKFSVGDSRF